MSGYLIHYGILGQKWGKRNYQYEDGSLTPEGRIHYGIGPAKANRDVKKAFKEYQKTEEYKSARRLLKVNPQKIAGYIKLDYEIPKDIQDKINNIDKKIQMEEPVLRDAFDKDIEKFKNDELAKTALWNSWQRHTDLDPEKLNEELGDSFAWIIGNLEGWQDEGQDHFSSSWEEAVKINKLVTERRNTIENLGRDYLGRHANEYIDPKDDKFWRKYYVISEKIAEDLPAASDYGYEKLFALGRSLSPTDLFTVEEFREGGFSDEWLKRAGVIK